jgi:GNAT superfamily N-acetyltransferase
MEIAELDIADDAALREFYDVERAAHAADRAHDVPRTWPQLLQMVREPSPYFRRVLLAARDDGKILATADIGVPLQDNLHLAHVEVRVLPGARRRGLGTAVHDEVIRRGRSAGRTTFLSEVFRPDAATPSPASEFAEAMGYVDVHREEHQLLALPADVSTAPAGRAGYEVLTWYDRAPDDLLDAYAVMRTRLLVDIPSGGVDVEPVTFDAARLREEEQRTAHAYSHLVAVARRTADGELGGYTKVFLPRDLDYVVQDDTMVMGPHRGQGLGLLLKAAVLRILAADHPSRRVVHTWNAVDNLPMKRINRELGFRPVELAVEMQRREPHA